MIIRMYRSDQYDGWHSAFNSGGVYTLNVFSIGTTGSVLTREQTTILNDIKSAIALATNMMDGNAEYVISVEG